MKEKLNKNISIKYFHLALYSLPAVLFLIVALNLNFLGDYDFRLLSILFFVLLLVESVIWILIKLSQKFHMSKKVFLTILCILPLLGLKEKILELIHLKTKSILIGFVVTSILFLMYEYLVRRKYKSLYTPLVETIINIVAFIFIFYLISSIIQYYL